MASDSLVLMSNAKNKDLAYSLIQYMLDGESMTEYHRSPHDLRQLQKMRNIMTTRHLNLYMKRDGERLSTPLSPAKGASKIGDTLYKNLHR